MPMLERIHIENYKCLREVTVQLGDFTILIGPNDSGKSSFLDVIESLGKIPTQSLQQLFSGDKALSNLVWRKQKDRKLSGKYLERHLGMPSYIASSCR